MAREYEIPMSNVTLANNNPVSLVFFQAMTATPITALEILRVFSSQRGTATSAQVGVQLTTQVSTFPTLTSQAPQKIKATDPAAQLAGGTAGAAGTSGVNASAEGAGSKTVIKADNFNNLNGYLWVPNPLETVIETAQATAHGWGVSLPSAPSSLGNWCAGVTLRELG